MFFGIWRSAITETTSHNYATFIRDRINFRLTDTTDPRSWVFNGAPYPDGWYSLSSSGVSRDCLRLSAPTSTISHYVIFEICFNIVINRPFHRPISQENP